MFPYPKKASVGMGYAGAKIDVYLFFCRGLGVSCPRYRNVKPEGLLMAKGRPRKPTKLKILEGNRGRRPLSRNEPEYEPTVPKPSDLSPLASEWWDHVVPQLVRLGLAQSVDLHSLVITAEDYAEWDRASRLYRDASPTVMRGSSKVPVLDEQGNPVWDGEGDERRQRVELRPILVTNPLLRAVRDFGAAYRQGAQAFGLNAQSRSILSVPDRDFEDLDRGFDEWQAALRLQEGRRSRGEKT